VIYTIQDDGKRLARLSAGGAGGDDAAGGRGRGARGGGGFGGGIGSLNITRDGRTLFYMEAGSVYSIALPGAGAGAAGGGTADRGGAGAVQRRQITFTTKVKINSRPNGRRCSTTRGAQ